MSPNRSPFCPTCSTSPISRTPVRPSVSCPTCKAWCASRFSSSPPPGPPPSFICTIAWCRRRRFTPGSPWGSSGAGPWATWWTACFTARSSTLLKCATTNSNGFLTSSTWPIPASRSEFLSFWSSSSSTSAKRPPYEHPGGLPVGGHPRPAFQILDRPVLPVGPIDHGPKGVFLHHLYPESRRGLRLHGRHACLPADPLFHPDHPRGRYHRLCLSSVRSHREETPPFCPGIDLGGRHG